MREVRLANGAIEAEAPVVTTQEPAFGSPEAVALAAEAIQGFTPGPWRAAYPSRTSNFGARITRVDNWPAKPLVQIAEVHWRYPNPAAEANAALIAAAPDLLRERDELLAEKAAREAANAQNAKEVERIAAEVFGECRAELERERADGDPLAYTRAEVNVLRITVAERDDEVASLKAQRDALADALEKSVATGFLEIIADGWRLRRDIYNALRAVGRRS